MVKTFSRLFLAGAIWTVALSQAFGGIWILRQMTHTGDSGVIDSNGIDSVGFAPNFTALTEWSVDAKPKKLHEISVGGYHLERAIVKNDLSEVIGSYQDGATQKWIVYNFARMLKDSKVTTISPPPNFVIVDAAYIGGHVAMLSRRGSTDFNCYVAGEDFSKWTKTFETSNGDLSTLEGFTYARVGVFAAQVRTKLLGSDSPTNWWELFGGHGASALGGFDPQTGIVAVKGGMEGNQVKILRATSEGALSTIMVDGSHQVQQIAVVGDITYVLLGGETVLAFDRDGNQIARLWGTSLVETG